MYLIWCSALDAARVMASSHSMAATDLQLLARDIEDSYHMFRILEEDMDLPSTKLAKQQLFQLSLSDIQFLCDWCGLLYEIIHLRSYYALDVNFAREVAGRKIGTKQRKEVDEISLKTRISLASCRRQVRQLSMASSYSDSMII